MKSNLKSASIPWFLCSFFVISLTACSDQNAKMPDVFSGIEVPDDVLNEPRLVAAPTQADLANKSYPRLGDVPSKPTDFSKPDVIDRERDEMVSERKAGQEARIDMENQPLPPPPFIQP